MEVAGFHGPELSCELSGTSRAREWLARINAALEEWVLGTEAKHYGKRQIIPGLYPP